MVISINRDLLYSEFIKQGVFLDDFRWIRIFLDCGTLTCSLTRAGAYWYSFTGNSMRACALDGLSKIFLIYLIASKKIGFSLLVYGILITITYVINSYFLYYH